MKKSSLFIILMTALVLVVFNVIILLFKPEQPTRVYALGYAAVMIAIVASCIVFIDTFRVGFVSPSKFMLQFVTGFYFIASLALGIILMLYSHNKPYLAFSEDTTFKWSFIGVAVFFVIEAIYYLFVKLFSVNSTVEQK